jgi:hypothetical protein
MKVFYLGTLAVLISFGLMLSSCGCIGDGSCYVEVDGTGRVCQDDKCAVNEGWNEKKDISCSCQ